MGRLARVRAALAEAIVVGAFAGAVEGARVVIAGGSRSVGAWAVVSAVAAVGAFWVAAVLAGIFAMVRRSAVAGSFWAGVDAGGSQRALALWRAGLVIGSLGVCGAVGFAVLSRAHAAFRFVDSEAFGLLIAGTLVVVAALVVFIAIELDRRLSSRIEASGRLSSLVAGRRLWGSFAALCGVLALGPVLIVHVAAPALSLSAPIAVSSLLLALSVARAFHLGRRGGAQIVAGAFAVVCVVGLVFIPRADAARGLIVEHGLFSRTVFRALAARADSDGDGYAGPSFGGADCDDSRRDRNPSALEIAGNGVDENCSNADADPSELADRYAVSSASPRGFAPSIVLITVDALRADRLGASGYRRPTSPAIDSFANRSTRFEWAVTTSPLTRHAFRSVFTGRYPSPLETPQLRPGGPQVPTLAQTLAKAGWDTVAITCCERFGRATNELSGFSTLDVSADASRMQRAGQSNGDVVADKAIAWLGDRSERDPPYFLWVHFYEPHHPYLAPARPERFGDTDPDRYDAEIAFVDGHIGRVLAVIDDRFPDAIVALTSDHGEEFNEHGLRFHARSLYNQVVRVPLIVRAPGASPRTVKTPVSLIDVMPTLLELAGEVAPPGMNGRSLAPAIYGGPAPQRPILLEVIPDRHVRRDITGLISGPWKVIWDREANVWSLYARDADPGDRTDVAGAEPAVLEAMRRQLHSARDRELSLPAGATDR